MPSTVVAEIAEKLRERQAVYEAAWAADVCRLCAEHGEAVISDALQLIAKKTKRGDGWDQRRHARAVKAGIARALAEHRQPDSLPLDIVE
jgi:hypothetical protein